MRFQEWVKTASEEELLEVATKIAEAVQQGAEQLAEEKVMQLAQDGVIQTVARNNAEQVTDTVDRPDLDLMDGAVAEIVANGDVKKIEELVGALSERYGEKVAGIAISKIRQQTTDAMVAGTIPKEVGEPLIAICQEYLKNVTEQ